MPSNRFIKRFLVALAVVIAAIGQVYALAAPAGAPVFAGKTTSSYQGQHKQGLVFELLSSRPSKSADATIKRHKRPLPSKALQPVVAFTFIKRYRVITSATDYSSPHILQRAPIVFSLRGPPAIA